MYCKTTPSRPRATIAAIAAFALAIAGCSAGDGVGAADASQTSDIAPKGDVSPWSGLPAKPASLICTPCHSSPNCRSEEDPDAVCVDQGASGAFCGASCTIDSDCPNDGVAYICAEATAIEGPTVKQCVRAAENGAAFGLCPCSPWAAALLRSTWCKTVSGCTGARFCTGGGLGDCEGPVASDEVCNGQDDDCDGAVDEFTCDDTNVCTNDSCSAHQGCIHEPTASACNDGSQCTTQDSCVGGHCLGTQPVSCDDGNPCSDDWCEPLKSCQHADNAATCDDDDPCTTGDGCEAAACVGGPEVICADLDPCTIDSCDPDSGLCEHEVAVDGAACGDQLVCAAGVCVAP